MKFGKLIILAGIFAVFTTPMFADQIYGEFDASGQGAITASHSAATGLTVGGTIGLTGGGNVRPTGTVTQDGTGVFGYYTESESFFYHFIATGSPGLAPFLFSTVTTAGAAGVEFLQATANGVTMKFYVTTVADKTINSGSLSHGTTGGFDGVGYVTFSNVFANGKSGPLYQESVEYAIDVNKGAGQKPFTVEIDATGPGPVPEPSSLALLGTGMMSVTGLIFRKRGKVQA